MEQRQTKLHVSVTHGQGMEMMTSISSNSDCSSSYSMLTSHFPAFSDGQQLTGGESKAEGKEERERGREGGREGGRERGRKRGRGGRMIEGIKPHCEHHK